MLFEVKKRNLHGQYFDIIIQVLTVRGFSNNANLRKLGIPENKSRNRAKFTTSSGTV
jgi:hypothetical protein